MKLAVHLAHPSQYYIFREVARRLPAHVRLLVTYNDKDVLARLMAEEGFGERAVRVGTPRGGGGFAANARQFLAKGAGLYRVLRAERPDLVAGTSVAVAQAARLLGIPSMIFTEDDYDIIGLSARLGYPFATAIVTPEPCVIPHWREKQVRYPGYQKLAYLHPRSLALRADAEPHVDPSGPYALLRFAQLTAHHDVGVGGLGPEVARRVVELLESRMRVYVTSEKPLPPEFERLRLSIPATRIHSVLAGAELLVGDSQSMAVEAAMLGVPSVRFSGFAGRISVLEELEHVYGLTFGVPAAHPERLVPAVRAVLEAEGGRAEWRRRRDRMLADKIDVAAFFAWLLSGYPESARVARDPELRERFR
jgi:predicted glycosyltransferase